MKHYQKNLLIPLLMAIVMMAMSPQRMWADDILVGGATEFEISSAGGSCHMPFYFYYYNGASISLYKASEIGASGKINSISFYVQSELNLASTETKIYLAVTDWTGLNETFDPSTANFTLVYDGTRTLAAQEGWEEYQFTTPYKYDSSKNLLVATTRKSNEWSSDKTYSVYTVEDADYTLHKGNDNDASAGELIAGENGLKFQKHTGCNHQKPCLKINMTICTHSWSEWTKSADATCTVAEKQVRTCSKCEESEYKYVGDPIAHTKDHEYAAVDAASCTTPGNIAYYHCSACNKYYNSSDEEIAENSWVTTIPHTKDHEYSAVDPTCTADGNIAYYHCSACNKYYNSSDEEIAENSWVITKRHVENLDHKDAAAATCTAEGNHEYWWCSGCNQYFKEETCENAYTDDTDETTGVFIAATGHTYSESFDTDGLKTCSTCGGSVGEEPTKVSEESNPFYEYYAISKPGHLVWFRDKQQEKVHDAVNDEDTYPYAGINAYLVNDINLSAVCHAANTETGVAKLNWYPIGAKTNYLGTFDGNSKAITGLYVNGEPRNGLFASIGEGAKVKNLTVKGDVTGPNAAIIISQTNGNAEITNCTSKGTVNGTTDSSAGVLGVDYSGNKAIVSYCTNYATITSTGSNVGGVVGNKPLKVEHCVNHGDVTGYNNTGGVVGYMSSPTNPVSDCANDGNVSSTYSGNNIGGVVGNGHSILRCSNHGNVTATSATNVGGISGIGNGGGQYGLKDCVNTGDIKGSNYVGGLSGNLCAANNADSYSTGKVESSSPYGGLLIGYYYNDPSAALSNVYYVKGATVKANGTEIANQIQGAGNTIQTPAKAVESADVASGKLAMLLRGDSETSTWGQDLANTNKAYPVLGGPKVYFSGSYKCNGLIVNETYTNDASQAATIPAHSSEYDNDGFCTACGESKTLHGTGTADDPYLISSVAQLEQFSTMSNANSSAYYGGCAKLVNDIDLSLSSNAAWTPICTNNSNSNRYGYIGTFDGNGHTVKNMYVSLNGVYSGFIAKADTYYGAYAVIKDLTVEGDVRGYVGNMGMIIGFSYGTDIINCTAKGSVQNYSEGSSAYTGGITGYNTYCGTVRTFEGCVNYADVSSAASNVGGILGFMSNPVIISKCTNYGNISSSNTNVGGILGYGCANGGFTMSDCANYGDVSTKASNVAGLVGQVNPNSSNTIKDCYVGPCSVRGNSNTYVTTFEPSASLSTFSNIVYSKDCKVYSSYSATSPATLSSYVAYYDYNTSAAFVGVSAAQIASGEATYMLNGSVSGGATWTQDLTKADGQPTLLGDADQYGVYLMGYAHGATARSFSNDMNKKNILHPAADDNGSHDTNYAYTSNGNQTHEALCSVCGHEKHNEACDMVNSVCSKCLYELLSTLQLVDGTAYTRTSSATATSLTYKRTFANTTYSALYVPFAMQYSDWSEKADVYRLLNIFEEDEDDNGTIDKWVLKIVKLKAGESIKANTPYIIKAKATGEMEITLQNATLASAQEKSIWCASTDYKFVFTGTYAQKAIAADSYFFMSTTGGLQYAASAVTLNPQRWYMGIYNKDTDALVAPTTFNPQASPVKAFSIVCDDDDATGIDEVTGINSQVSGKYLENGKVVIVRNGKKYTTSGMLMK